MTSSNRRLTGANHFTILSKATFLRLSRALICVALGFNLWTTAIASTVDTNSPSSNFTARLQQAVARPKIDDRLAALDELGRKLALTEIPTALKAADELKQLRERVVLTQAALKRWGELGPSEAFARVSELPEGVTKGDSLRSIFPLYATKDIPAAAKAVTHMKPGRARNEAAQMLVESFRVAGSKFAIDVGRQQRPRILTFHGCLHRATA